jgi:hypothetical protein
VIYLKKGQLVALSIITVSFIVIAGCFEGEEQSKYNKKAELISAWGGITDSDNPTNHPIDYTEDSFTADQYQRVNSSDDEVVVYSGIGYGWGYPYCHFIFKLTGNETTVKLIWEGCGIQHDSEIQSKVDIFLYIETIQVWTKIANDTWEGTDEFFCVDKMIEYKIENVQNYKTTMDEISVLIIGSYGEYDDKSQLGTDLIELRIK